MDLHHGGSLLKEKTRNGSRNDSTFSTFWIQLAILAIIVLTVIYWQTISQWLVGNREADRRRQARRKYGIPDDDNDPFNIAYQRAAKRREEEERVRRVAEEEQARNAKSISSKDSNSNELRHRPGALTSIETPLVAAGSRSSNTRTRFYENASSSSAVPFPKGTEERALHPALSSRGKGAVVAQSMPGSAMYDEVEHSPLKAGPSTSNVTGLADESAKDNVVDVDADDSMDVTELERSSDQLHKSKRGAKRQAGPELDDGDYSRRKTVLKRARKTSGKKGRSSTLPEINEDEDQLMELDSIIRGKKRDRAEADSTFGGDEDSPDGQGRKSRRRKRKSGLVDGDLSQSRGTKRTYDIESTVDSEDELKVSRLKSARKRGKCMSDDDSATDVSMDNQMVSKDPACGGRRIGEKWQVGGQMFKVGPDGRRLRQALVRQRRSRFSMPSDSEHPDSRAEMVILVEKWLDDEDFQAAEERGDIFSPEKVESQDNGDVEDLLPSKSGKPLLWSSPSKKAPVPRKAFKDSIVTNVGLAVNPFERPTYSDYGRRVSTSALALRPSTPESPVLRHSRSYSKWEKQDLEAEAMTKLRKRLEDQKKVPTPDAKKVSFNLPPSVSAPPLMGSISAPAGVGLGEKTTKPPVPPFAFNAPSNNAAKISTTPSTLAQTDSSSSASNTTRSAFTFPSNPRVVTEDKPETAAAKGFPSKLPQSETKAPAPSPFTPPQNPPANFGNIFGGKGKETAASTGAAAPAPQFSFGAKPAEASSTPGNAATANPFNIKGAGGQQDKPQTPSFGNAGLFKQPAPPASSPFTFGGPSAPAQKEREGQGDASTGSSLLSRVGGFSAPAPANIPQPVFGGPSTSGLSIGGSKPPISEPAKATDGSVSATPKFSFGFNKPAIANNTASVTNVDNTKPPTSTNSAAPAAAFQFTVTPPQQVPASVPNPVTAEQPKQAFSFGQAAGAGNFGAPVTTPAASSMPSSTSSIFGAVTAPKADVPVANASSAPATNQPKFSFNFSNAGNAFGSAAKPAEPSTTGGSPFSGGGPFGSFGGAPSNPSTAVMANKQNEVPKPLFGLNNTPSATATATATAPVQTNALTTDKPPEKSPFSFTFGGQAANTGSLNSNSSSLASAVQPTPAATTVFGQPVGQPSATPASSSNSSSSALSNIFGAKPAGPTPFKFGAVSAAPSSVFGSANNSTFGASSPFGASAAPGTGVANQNIFGNPTPSVFGAPNTAQNNSTGQEKK